MIHQALNTEFEGNSDESDTSMGPSPGNPPSSVLLQLKFIPLNLISMEVVHNYTLGIQLNQGFISEVVSAPLIHVSKQAELP